MSNAHDKARKARTTTIFRESPPTSAQNVTQGEYPLRLLLYETAGGNTPICLTSLSVYNIYIMHRYASMVGK